MKVHELIPRSMLKIDSIKYNRVRARWEEGRTDTREWPHTSQKVLLSSKVALQKGHSRIQISRTSHNRLAPGVRLIRFYFLAKLAWRVYIM